MQAALGLKYLAWTKRLKPASARLRVVVESAAIRAGVRARSVWILESEHALAFAFPTTNELLFTEPLLDLCDDEELSAICTHELAHLSESKYSRAGRLLGSLSMFPFIFILPMVHLWGVGGLLAVCFVYFSWVRSSHWFSHKMEERADQAAIAQQVNDGVYARTLNQILLFKTCCQRSILTTGRLIPHLYDRLIAAGIKPEFETSPRPEKITVIGRIYASALGILFVAVLIRGHLM